MPADRFDVVFRGQLMEGQDPAQVRAKVGRLFKANEAQLQRLFSGKPVSIKQGVDVETASRYRQAFRQAGALVEIRASRQAEAQRAAADADKKTGFSLAAANSGSLEDYAERPPPAPLPDISGLDLAAAGSDHETAPDLPPPAIATDGLDLVQDRDWTLEDCQPPPLPVLEPELDHLDLANLDDTSHIPPEPPPVPLPDIEDLDLAALDDTSHIPPEPPPAPLPDIDDLSLQPAEDEDENESNENHP